MLTTLNDELTSLNENKWCIVFCAEKSLCPSDFFITFLISFVGLLALLQLQKLIGLMKVINIFCCYFSLIMEKSKLSSKLFHFAQIHGLCSKHFSFFNHLLFFVNAFFSSSFSIIVSTFLQSFMSIPICFYSPLLCIVLFSFCSLLCFSSFVYLPYAEYNFSDAIWLTFFFF